MKDSYSSFSVKCIGWRATATSCVRGNSDNYKKKKNQNESGYALEHVAQRCEISILADTQKLTGQGPEQPYLTLKLALKVRLGRWEWVGCQKSLLTFADKRWRASQNGRLVYFHVSWSFYLLKVLKMVAVTEKRGEQEWYLRTGSQEGALQRIWESILPCCQRIRFLWNYAAWCIQVLFYWHLKEQLESSCWHWPVPGCEDIYTDDITVLSETFILA